MAATGRVVNRARRARRTPPSEPVVTVHVTYVPRGHDLAFDARWDAFWARALAPLIGDDAARKAAQEGRQQQQQQQPQDQQHRQHKTA